MGVSTQSLSVLIATFGCRMSVNWGHCMFVHNSGERQGFPVLLSANYCPRDRNQGSHLTTAPDQLQKLEEASCTQIGIVRL